jgi:hypothetical protein
MWVKKIAQMAHIFSQHASEALCLLLDFANHKAGIIILEIHKIASFHIMRIIYFTSTKFTGAL